jgi:hypothetical protein
VGEVFATKTPELFPNKFEKVSPENGAVIKSFVELPATYFWYLYVPEPEILVAFKAAEEDADDCITTVPLLVNVPLIFREPATVGVAPLYRC